MADDSKMSVEDIAEAFRLDRERRKEAEKTVEERAKEIERIGRVIEKLKEVEAIHDRDQLILEETKRLRKEELALIDQRIRQGEELTEELQNEFREAKRNVALIEERLSIEEDINKEVRKSTDLYSKVNAEAKKIAVAFETGKSSALALNRTMMGFDKLSSMGINKLVSVSKELFFSFDSVSKEFAKATQLGDSFTDTVTNTYTEMNLYGVSLEDAAKANRDLISTVSDFTLSSESQRQAVSNQVAILNELGVATQDSTRAIQNSMKFMGSSMAGASADVAQLTQDAKALGMEAGAAVAQYAQMGPELAKFGDDSIRTFKDLARIQKITGMEMQKVLNITNKFDTFEGAATQAGQLNAALGGNFVNAMDLMMATDPAERFMMIRDSILDAGLSFDEMSYYQKQFYVESLGLSDVGDLAMMLSGNMDSLVGSTNDSAASLISQKEKAQANMAIMEQLKSVFLELGEAIMPLTKRLSSILKFFQDSPGLTQGIITAFAAWKVISTVLAIRNGFLAASFFAMAAGQTASAAASRKMAASVIPLTLALAALGTIGLLMRSPSLLVAAFVGLATGVYLAGMASDTAVNQFRRLAPALIQVGIGAFLITGGFALMAAAFSLLSVEQMAMMTASVLLLGAGLYALGMAGVALAPGLMMAGLGAAALGAGLMPLAASIALIAGAVGVAAVGIGFMAEGIGQMFTAMTVEKALALGGLLAGIALGAPLLFMAGIGMFSLAAGMAFLSLVLKTIATKDLEAIALFTSSLAEINVAEIREVATAIREVADAMDGIPVMPTIMLRHVMEQAEVTAAAIKALRGQPQQAQPAAAGGAAARGGQSNFEVTVPIELKMDGQVFDTKVVKIYKREEGIRAQEIKRGEA